MNKSRGNSRLMRKGLGFTLVELVVAMAVFSIILVILMSLMVGITNSWMFAIGKAGQFNEAANGFEAINRRLSQATLNTYMNYVNINGNAVTYITPSNASTVVPNGYARASELRFICGPNLAGGLATSPVRPTQAIFFQAPLGFVSDQKGYGGLSNLLNTWGYYIEFNSDVSMEPSFISGQAVQPRYRFRLMEMMQPSESLSVYKYTSGNVGLTSSQMNGMNWFTDPLTAGTYSHILAENIVALIIIPKLSPQDQSYAASLGDTAGDGMLAPNYSYDTTSSGQAQTISNSTLAGIVDSRNQLPPLVQITMVAVDEVSFKRFIGNSTTAPDLGMGTLFQNVGDTKNPANPGYAQDLQILEQKLVNEKLNYQVFNTTVAIKSARWSSSETN